VGHGPIHAPEGRQEQVRVPKCCFFSAYEMVGKGQEPGKSYEQHITVGSISN
jgi:hypothetical protein